MLGRTIEWANLIISGQRANVPDAEMYGWSVATTSVCRSRTLKDGLNGLYV